MLSKKKKIQYKILYLWFKEGYRADSGDHWTINCTYVSYSLNEIIEDDAKPDHTAQLRRSEPLDELPAHCQILAGCLYNS